MTEMAAQFWDSIADEWRQFATRDAARIAPVVESLGCAPGSLVLDAGCGAGGTSIPLALGGYRMRGIDIAPRMIANAQDAAREQHLDDAAASFQQGSVERLPFPDATFDAIVCMAVLDFAAQPGVALAEFWRVLKPGSRLLLTMLGAYSTVKRDWWRRFLPDSAEGRVRNHILPWEMESLLGALGWQIIAQRPVTFGRSFDGGTSRYTPEMAEALADQVLQQTVAGLWWFTALKPA